MAGSRTSGIERRTVGLGGSVAAAVLWGFAGIFVALTYAPGLVLTFYRLWMGAAVFAVVLYGSGGRLSWSLLRATWLGGILLAGDMAMFYCAVKTTSIVDVTVIGALQPALVMIVSRRLFAERLARRDVGWIVLAMVGVAIAVIGPGVTNRHEVVGDVLAVGSMVSFSAYWMASKHARQLSGALEYTTGVTMVAAVVMAPVVVLSGQSLGQIRGSDWWWIALLVAVPGSGHLVMNWAHRFVDASISSAISCLSPLIAAIAAIPILGQPLTSLQVSGVLVGLVAIAVIAVHQRQPLESPVE
jgi:drug/metabolite transporter (DMT)-like permease